MRTLGLDETVDQLAWVTNQMDALAAELGRVKDNAPRRAEIIAQIIRLGRLYVSIRNRSDFILQDR